MIYCPPSNPQRQKRAAKRKTTSPPLKNPCSDFVLLHPAIRDHARISFRKLPPEMKEDLVEECVANAFRAYARLVELKKQDMIYPTVLAKFAVKQVRDGRRVGTPLNSNEVLSRYAQRRKNFKIESLAYYDHEEEEWLDAVVEDQSTPVPEQAAFRVDFPAWLKQHLPPKRRVAEALALGYTTGEVATRFALSSGRVSQMRREFEQSWEEYQGEPPESLGAESLAVA
jgi:DNA-directed RNA polymerase specialized sigma24 family protein